MRNSLTAQAALLVIATAISFASPATLANEPYVPPRTASEGRSRCTDLTTAADATCKILRAGVSLMPKEDQAATSETAETLCKCWLDVAENECRRLLKRTK